ncbi:erythrocyte membrane-associated antigen [Cryptosporidium felis]|nr:erythrocyte membrane-associated antigen [Cryptosporidium felis]
MSNLNNGRKSLLWSLCLDLLFLVTVTFAVGKIRKESSSVLPENDEIKIPVILDKLSNKLGVDLIVGNQTVRLAIDTMNEGVRLFQNGTEACNKRYEFTFYNSSIGNLSSELGFNERSCYDPLVSYSATWCHNKDHCRIGLYRNAYNCEKNKEFPSSDLNSALSPFFHTNERIYDGILKTETVLEGNEMIALPWITPELVLHEFPIKLINNNLSVGSGENWPSFQSFDGFLGFVGSSISCRGISIWADISMLFNISKYTFDIDFANQDSSFIYLTGQPKSWIPDLIYWSESKQTGSAFDDALTLFQIYNFNACGSMVIEDVSSNWLAALDLSSTCLSLPSFIYYRLTKWLPIECPNSRFSDIDIQSDESVNSTDSGADTPLYPYSSLCKVKKRPLPVISFWLSQFDSDNQKEPIYIFLNDYIINYNGTDYLCILNSIQSSFGKVNYLPQNEEFGTNNYSPQPVVISSSAPLILFGSLLLKSYGIIIDNQNGKVGLYPKFKKPNLQTLNSNCSPKKDCASGYTFDSSLNECIPPNCSEWFLYEFDPKTNKCVLGSIYPIILALIMILFTFFELHIMYLKQYIIEKSSATSSI